MLYVRLSIMELFKPNTNTFEETYNHVRSLSNGRGSWVVGRGYKSWVVGVGVGND